MVDAVGIEQRPVDLFGCDGNHSSVRRMCFGEESAYSYFLQNYFSITIVDKLLIEEDTARQISFSASTLKGNSLHSYRDQDEQRDIILQQFRGEGWRTRELFPKPMALVQVAQWRPPA